MGKGQVALGNQILVSVDIKMNQHENLLPIHPQCSTIATAVSSQVTQILSQIESGDRQSASQLLPLVYEELRRLASQRMLREKSSHTLQPTALFHEAFSRLVGGENSLSWDGRGHFFAAAAEAMRRILIESARRRNTEKRGGDWERAKLEPDVAMIDAED